MEQRGVIHFYFKMNVPNKEIHSHLVEVYGEDALSLKSVEYWTHEFKVGRNTIEDSARSGRPKEISYRFYIQSLVEDDPYISARQIAKTACIPLTTVLDILKNELGYNYRHLRWIPHQLTCQMKKNRVTQCTQILNALRSAKRSHFSNIITGDESWFLYVNQPKARWVLADEDPGEIVEPSIYQKKIMVTIFIRKNGTFFVELLPEGQKFNSAYFTKSIIPLISDLAYPNGYKQGDKKCLLHFDNAPSHRSNLTKSVLAKYPFKMLPNPAYSPDVSPLDFGVLGTVKSKMPIIEIESEEALKEAIESILSDLGMDFFKQLFRAWEERLEKVINANGSYI